MSHLDALKASRSDLVYLVRGKERASGKDAWYYVQVQNKAKLPVFLEKVKSGITLTDYAEILYSGWGADPPDDIRAKIKERFGI